MRLVEYVISFSQSLMDEFNKYWSTNARFYLLYDIKITLKGHF